MFFARNSVFLASFRGHGEGILNIQLVLAHPAMDSFNHAIADECRKTLLALGHVVWYHDLYAEGFDPMLQSAEVPREAALDDVL